MFISKELQEFFEQPPEEIIEWRDRYSPAKGWLVVNSWRGGAAGGGTRMRARCQKDEVVELAKTMEIKFTVSGPAIGGAKSGISYNFKNQTDKHEVLKRWFKHIEKELKSRYGTGGDQNVDQTKDVMPIFSELGIRHSQEGIVRGLYKNLAKSKQDKIIENLHQGVNLPIKSDKFAGLLSWTMANVCTGFGVVSAAQTLEKLNKSDLKNKKIIIEGFGCVGSAAAYYFWKNGAKVVEIIEKNWRWKDEAGIDIPFVLKNIIQINNGELLNSNLFGGMDDRDIVPADIFVPAATSHTIDEKRLNRLIKLGIRQIIPGANNPFDSLKAMSKADKVLSVVPDFIANCGTARLFAYLMQPGAKLKEKDILRDINHCVESALKVAVKKGNSLFNINLSAEKIAGEKLKNYGN